MAKLIVTGPYTAYLAAQAARREYTRANQSDSALMFVLNTAPVGSWSARARADMHSKLDNSYQRCLRATCRLIEAGNDLDWERFHAGDWEACD
jgi:hypothetical protein